MKPLKFKPIFMERIWGGDALKTKYGFNVPYGKKIGELWCISDNTTAVSEVDGGIYDGVKLSELVNKHGDELYGEGKSYDRFPLLIKIIDANDKLSVQVHPDDDYAYHYENGDIGKTEMWYIIDAKPGAKLICGLKEGTTKEQFKSLLEKERLEECLNEIEVKPGDVVYIPSGMVHAIGEGILICEIQQNSDLTYRVYDYNRVDDNGNKRELHIDKALDVIDFNLKSDKIVPKYKKVDGGSIANVVQSKYFKTDVIYVESTVNIETNGIFNTLVMVEGEGKIIYEDGEADLKSGESLLIPASIGKYTITGNCKLIRSYV
ncbi:mannose-6-phosphate isomerase, class I [Thermoanaerobacterium sp. PSU-2]|uniref:mannose-6-phosphate isomerase, class I n=1 Tax=Thermoanaerobacterium sp. PSU-2 TaxID=1930849 RepID=UPI000A1607B4|nr:mannose-6-phosphate isomerase, class I [Thermoanaerobacterium sp. PSU-2]ORX24342.1 mannose-6-phosphate isomerase, class I [Thermoanaerobacterium sp. PSU-2]